MTSGPPVLPLAVGVEPVRYVLIDDEPRYRQVLDAPGNLDLALAGSYGTVEAFIAIQRQPCHVVILDLCLNRQTGDKAVLKGVGAIRQLTGQLGHRVVVYTADERPEPVARCVAAGAAAYISKYDDSPSLARAVDEVGRHGSIVCDSLHRALRKLAARNGHERCSDRQGTATFGADDRRPQAQDPGDLRHYHGGPPPGLRRAVPRPGHPAR